MSRLPKDWCRFCQWATPSEREVGASLTRHGHRLYLVAIGTTWRLRWAVSAASAKEGALSDLSGTKGLHPPKVKVRRARPTDLDTLDVISAAGR